MVRASHGPWLGIISSPKSNEEIRPCWQAFRRVSRNRKASDMAHGAGCSRIPPSGQIHGKRESLRLHESVSMKTFSKKTIRRYFSGALIALMLSSGLWAQGNDKLQLHFIDVGQGDGAILISPGGQVVAFDIGQDLVHRN